ncbi:hypothetical protein FQA47_000225 [Oryzias melastigma]|uniref:Uncharacterized protein n=1 Tax=Oryzias melastigma TaxID=30732 RepID=A0A834FBZ8_ORYME|nr:hypothetical protein FQA47_000225 [Oryzias melastigma]
MLAAFKRIIYTQIWRREKNLISDLTQIRILIRSVQASPAPGQLTWSSSSVESPENSFWTRPFPPAAAVVQRTPHASVFASVVILLLVLLFGSISPPAGSTWH